MHHEDDSFLIESPSDLCRAELGRLGGGQLWCERPIEQQALIRSRLCAAWGVRDDQNVILSIGSKGTRDFGVSLAAIAAQLERIRPQDDWRIASIVQGASSARHSVAGDRRMIAVCPSMELWDVYHAVDLGVLIPEDYSPSAAIVAALGAGLPIVAGADPTFYNFLYRRAGFLCRADDPAAYARALASLLDDAPLRFELAEEAYRCALEHIDLGDTADTVMRLARAGRDVASRQIPEFRALAEREADSPATDRTWSNRRR